MSALRGEHWVAGRAELGSGTAFHAQAATSGEWLTPEYREADRGMLERACQAAAAAAVPFALCRAQLRAELLQRIATGIEALGETLLDRYVAETGLPRARAEGERARTLAQLRMFAAVATEGTHVQACIDHGQSQRQPQARPDLRSMLVGMGPVAVFGASNFPLAYSVAGGDTASALAAGCPVIVKGHPAHPGVSELVGRAVGEAVCATGLPAGVFSLLHASSYELGAQLVQHPAIAAVGFTGSHRGGRALMDLAAARSEPIPVFAEMGSMNPVVVLPRALAQRGAAIGTAVAQSALLAGGQFCTSPGIVLWIAGPGEEALRSALVQHLGTATAPVLVHAAIRAGYEQSLREVQSHAVQVLAQGQAQGNAVCPTLLASTPQELLASSRLRTEIYGPAVLVVACADENELLAVLASLRGHLTATVHGEGEDLSHHVEVANLLRHKVGRLIYNGVPTGVEVTAAMVHGGPYPAASDVRFSAVGPTSIRRWLRPQCWQDWPDALLPEALQERNPLHLRRFVDGGWVAPQD